MGSFPLAPPGKPQAFSLRMQFEKLHTKRWVELPPLKSTCVLVKAAFWLRSDLPCQGQSIGREETAALSGFDRGGDSPPPRLWEETIQTLVFLDGCGSQSQQRQRGYQQDRVLNRSPTLICWVTSVQDCVPSVDR